VYERSGTNTKQVSRALEVRLLSLASSADAEWPSLTYHSQYAFDDFTISQVARHLGHKTDAVKVCIGLWPILRCGTVTDTRLQYAGRARNFVNHWNADIHGNVNITGVPGAPKSLRGMAQV
jgi:hypothetical protein